MKIAVSAESTCDLGKDLIEKFGIKTIPFEVVLGNDFYKDGEVKAEDIFDFVAKNKILPKTNAINEFEYTEYFQNIKNEYDAVIHVSLSSNISSSCANAKRAAENMENVFVVDSLTLSSGIGLLVLYAKKLVDEGLSAQEIYEKVQNRTSSVQASFVVERLDYLYKGGRCSSLARFGANLLKLRPRIVLKDGKMGSDKNYKGKMGSVIAKYGKDIFADFNTPDLENVFITCSSATEEMMNAAREAVKDLGFKNVYETRAGATITSHCGENTLGILYFNDGVK